MGLVLGVIAVLIILFFVLVMALAEWADTDLGELLGKILGRSQAAAAPQASGRKPAPAPASRAAAVKKPAAAGKRKKPASRPKAGKNSKPQKRKTT